MDAPKIDPTELTALWQQHVTIYDKISRQVEAWMAWRITWDPTVNKDFDGGDIEVCDEFVEVSWEETWSYGGGESHVVQIRLEDLADPAGFRARKEAEMAEREVHDRKAALARAQASAEYFRAQAQGLAAIDSGE